MLFQCSTFLLSIVLSLNLAVSLSLLAPYKLHRAQRCHHPYIHSHLCTITTRESSIGSSSGTSSSSSSSTRLAFTHLSYKSTPYHDGAETTTTANATPAPRMDKEAQAEHVDVPIESTSTTTTAVSVPIPQSTSPSPPPKKKRSRVIKSSVNGSKVRIVTTLKQFYKSFEEEYEGNRAGAGAAASKKQEEKVIIVRFFSHWCKSCQAIAPKYNRLARLYPNNVFIDIPVSKDNVDLQKALGIKAVPFAHIYYPKLHSRDGDGEDSNGSADATVTATATTTMRGYDEFQLMEELKIGKMYWSDFEDIFYGYINGHCNVSGMDYSDPIAASGSTIREYMDVDAGSTATATAPSRAKL